MKKIAQNTSELPLTSATTNPINYANVVDALEKRASERLNKEFQFDTLDYKTVVTMAAYFLNDTFMCTELGINLKKGILLAGPIGCGKTFLFELIRTILDYENQFKIKSCRSIVSEYAENGPLVIRQYTRGHIYHKKPFVFCFDDLGAEMNTNYYGTEINVLGEILLTRYDVFVRDGVKTHITTNLSTHEIDVIYGNRARSRFREMFNLVTFAPNVRDKRR